jgi:hypothetical protein
MAVIARSPLGTDSRRTRPSACSSRRSKPTHRRGVVHLRGAGVGLIGRAAFTLLFCRRALVCLLRMKTLALRFQPAGEGWSIHEVVLWP